MEHTILIQQEDGYKTLVYPYYTTAPQVIASIVVFHGMAEHHGRYEAFASFLNEHGFDVYLYDHRGHGTDKKLDELGYFSAKNGYKKVIQDGIQVLTYVSAHNRGKKLVLFGHSMGSLIARNVIQQYDTMDCTIICGSTCPSALTSKLGSFVTSLVCLFRGKHHRSPFIDNLLFGGKAYTSLCKRTSSDWLTRDNTVVGAYINDPYCGFLCTAAFYSDLIHLAASASKKSLLRRTRKDMPIFLISGANDPVGGYGKEITKLYQTYQKSGFTKVSCKLYPEGRHEILNELNKEEVMQDILTFLTQNL